MNWLKHENIGMGWQPYSDWGMYSVIAKPETVKPFKKSHEFATCGFSFGKIGVVDKAVHDTVIFFQEVFDFFLKLSYNIYVR